MLRVCEEAGLPLSLHFGSGGMPLASPRRRHVHQHRAVRPELDDRDGRTAAVPVFYKFPNLKVALSEGGIGWMPYMLERIDYSWGRHKTGATSTSTSSRPSCSASTSTGASSPTSRVSSSATASAMDNIMFESDYPHSDSNWPHTRKLLAEHLADVPDEEARKIVELNARTLYRFWD